MSIVLAIYITRTIKQTSNERGKRNNRKKKLSFSIAFSFVANFSFDILKNQKRKQEAREKRHKPAITTMALNNHGETREFRMK